MVAYVVEGGGFLSLEYYQLKIRRLSDNAEESFNAGVGCCENIQWITNKFLIARIESESP